MSADHRKPVVAFVVLAFVAATIVCVQRADAQSARFFAAFVGGAGEIHGSVPAPGAFLGSDESREATIGSAFEAIAWRERVTGSTRLDGAPFGRGEVTGLRDDSGELSRDHRSRPVKWADSAPRRGGGDMTRHDRGRGNGLGALVRAEKSLHATVEGGARGLGPTRRTAEDDPAAAHRGLGKGERRLRRPVERGNGPR